MNDFDIVAEFQRPIYETLVNFADALLDRVAIAKNVDVEDVRRQLVDPLRARIVDDAHDAHATHDVLQPSQPHQQQPAVSEDLEAALDAELAKYDDAPEVCDENTKPPRV